MPYFAVFNQAGAAWDATRPMREQQGWPEHAAFMDALAEDGFVRVGGPIGDGRPHRTMLIVEADSVEDIRSRFAADPWIAGSLLQITHIEPWTILLGDLSAA